ncbi:transmembrane protein 26 [Phlebotomus argentipes]|uniref:transmembrane protein 26 n=1 Tax=Phlebotomus argentipes TaxID=94469 RepID=UPI002892B404|nr:transmembrane protein 26 [Phlebotomus argentipes]
MAKFLASVKAIITRLIFGAHGLLAIWQCVTSKANQIWWLLSAPILLLVLEAIFTLTIKKNQEWRWFCPSVFLYLSSVVPAIWLLELEKMERRLRLIGDEIPIQAPNFKQLDKILGTQLKIPDIKVDTGTWITLIEQFLMLILIVGRWMLPKGDLTRDQLSQLLLVYIGTAADIIEFFDSFKDNTIANDRLLVLLTLGIWSWSLLQFTIVLSATRARKPRGSGGTSTYDHELGCCCCTCCSIDAWGIALNILLQDAPFLAFRLLIIIHYNIISYMNVFFTCKNTLVILLQLYRLYVVHTENRKMKSRRQERRMNDIYIISSGKHDEGKRRSRRNVESDGSEIEEKHESEKRRTKNRHASAGKKDTGYSTASSQTTLTSKSNEESHRGAKSSGRIKRSSHRSNLSPARSSKSRRKHTIDTDKKHRRRCESADYEKSRGRRRHRREVEPLKEEDSKSNVSEESIHFKVVNERKSKKKQKLSVSSESETSVTQ